MVFDGGKGKWKGCKVHAASGRAFFIGVCDIRNAPTDMDEASLTVTLVTGDGHRGVDTWHKYLQAKGSSLINTTTPHLITRFNCYAFNFYDVDADSLGNYRFEVQTFEDPTWPKPPLHVTTTELTTNAAPPAPQQVTWFYTKDLAASTKFINNVLGFKQVLDQGPCTIHSHPQGNSFFLGVCNSRPAPELTPPVTYTLVVESDSDVRSWQTFLSASNATNTTAAALVSKFNVFAFEFFDWNTTQLGWYRLSCQHFEDAAWPKV